MLKEVKNQVEMAIAPMINNKWKWNLEFYGLTGAGLSFKQSAIKLTLRLGFLDQGPIKKDYT